MNMLQRISYRFSPSTYTKVLKFRQMMKDSNNELKNHINDYYKRFLLPLFFARFYHFITPFGINVRKREDDFFNSNKSTADLRKIYKSKKTLQVFEEIINSSSLNQFEIYGLKFQKSDNRDLQKIMFHELKDLIIPYSSSNHHLYNLSLLGEGTYESKNVFVSEGDIVIDVGANMGVFTIFSILKRKAKLVYAFEPVQSVFRILESNCQLNDISKFVETVNKGLGDEVGLFDISISIDNIGANSLVFGFESNNIEKVEITTLDSFVDIYSIQQLDFIKVDIEGSERLFLEGAKKTLAKFKPKLSICTYHIIDDPVVLTKLILNANPDYKIEYYSLKLYAY